MSKHEILDKGEVKPIQEVLRIQADAGGKWLGKLKELEKLIVQEECVRAVTLTKVFKEFVSDLHEYTEALNYTVSVNHVLNKWWEKLRPRITVGCISIELGVLCYYCKRPAKHHHTIDLYQGLTHLGSMDLCGRCHIKKNAREFHRLLMNKGTLPVKEA